MSHVSNGHCGSVNRFNGHGRIKHKVLVNRRTPVAQRAQDHHVSQTVGGDHRRAVGQFGEELGQFGRGQEGVDDAFPNGFFMVYCHENRSGSFSCAAELF
jgi:hypothetical protein